MRTQAKMISVAAAVLLAAVGCQAQSGSSGTGGQATVAPSRTAPLLASGTFRFPPLDAAVVLDATGEGSDVTGAMTVSNQEMSFTVDLECALTAEDGRILIGGDTMDSTFDYAPAGTRSAIVLKPGSPVRAIFFWQYTDPAQPSCMAFLEDTSPETTSPEPIEGTVELGP